MEAQQVAQTIWGARSRPASDGHDYLRTKGVKSHGLRQKGRNLVVPLSDTSGEIWSLQYISPAGRKWFLKGGRKKFLYFALGTDRSSMLICEGYATGATCYEATGQTTIVAFDAGNLRSVGETLRDVYPDARLTFVADDDSHLEVNHGLQAAVEAAQTVRGLVAVPNLGGLS